ncbi:hypothetical protein Q3G72_026841 [Acer saccharum]|nr:hypothetical protein Q3G72_026841 [Acer saccharum]
MSILGEAVLTASVELLLKKLTSSELLSFANQERIHDDLKKWENTLRKISAVLEDAEEKQITSRFFSTELPPHQEASTSKLRKLIPNFKPQPIKFNVKMRAEMKKITERFQEITAQKNNLDLRENSDAKSNKVRDQRRHTTSLPESHVYGREKDQEAIIELLLKDEGCRFEIDGCKQLQLRTDIDLGSLNPMTFADFRGHAFLVKRFIQRLSEVEEVEIVGYKTSTSFWHSGIISLQEALTLCYSLFNHNDRLSSLLEEKEEELQLQGLPFIWQFLILDSVCLSKLPQVLNLDFLRRISIANCSELGSFPEVTLPSHLRSIDIDSCDALKCLPDTWMDCTSLECLSISYCESLLYLTRRQLFPNLKQLVIMSCKDLKT